jgi:uncharacterized protein (DUF1015 family)
MQILPSGGPPATGLALAPFRGLRYAENRVSGLAEVTSPPYDVIAHDTEDHLLAADPHNVVRLILPREDAGHPGAAYSDAARLLREWQDTGILVPDPQPALYVYEQSQAAGGGTVTLQRGLIGALRLVPLGAGPVLPHEDVVAGPVAGRRHLMEATRANLEPIFLLLDGAEQGHAGQEGHGAAGRMVTEVAESRQPLVAVATDDGIVHRLWAVTEPCEQAAIAGDLATRQALIADGHHRYAAYLQLQARMRKAGAGEGPWDAGLALLVDSAAFPPRIGAIHRVVPGLSAAEAVRRAKAAFTVQPVPRLVAGSPEAAMAALAGEASNGPSFLVVGEGEAHLLSRPDPAAVAAAMPGHSPRWRWLSAAILQELLLARLWGIADDERSVQIHHDPGEALRAAAEPPGGTAVICPPLSASDVREVASRGERVPRKSTSIGPKPRTGLVIRSFALG